MRDRLTRLWGLIIILAWIPLGLFGAWVEQKLPKQYQLPFFVLLLAAIIIYYVSRNEENIKSFKDKTANKSL
jgi:uncharacterized membrane protein YfcA